MELIVSGNAHVRWTGTLYTQIWKIMRLTTLLIFIATLHVSARTDAQKVSIESRKISLRQALGIIQQQTGYSFIVEKNILDKVDNLQVHLHNATIREALNACLAGLPYGYSIDGKIITLLDHSANPANAAGEPVTARDEAVSDILIRGRVTDSTGAPLAGATVKVRGTNNGALTDKGGNFNLSVPDGNAVIEVSFVGYATASITVGSERFFTVRMTAVATYLDESIVQAYGTTTRRFNTGNIAKVTAQEIEQQPVGNVLQALQGRVPGLNVTSTSGVPGSSVKIQVRGQNSIIGGNDPLILIDGVPFGPNNNEISQIGSALFTNTADLAGSSTQLSPFSSINPMDIESVEVLKDADATAIYGSRGANGVILITTKKGKTGNTKFNFNIYSGISNATRLPKMMNTQQYLAMRHEAFNNDGVTPNKDNAPDLTVFDTTRYTDFEKEYFGGTANMTNIYGSVSGGTGNTQYLISGTYREENNIYSHEKKNKTGTIYSNITTSSNNKRFKANISTSYTYNQNKQIGTTLGNMLSKPPDMPALRDSAGQLVWYVNGVNFYNPLAYMEVSYVAKTDNFNSSLQLDYEIIKGLTARANLGYNKVWLEETSLKPGAASNPEVGILRLAQFGNNNISSWSIEPQLQYDHKLGIGKLNVLMGSTWQSTSNKSSYIEATGQASDALLQDLTAAISFTPSNSYSLYHYQAFWGRINYNIANRYLINLTGRRDGSSRFGEDHKFSNFGAAGLGWIFSNESFIKDNLTFLSFGKLRGSYGITGNDQIGDYQYLDSWESTEYKYGGTNTGLQPTRLANSDFSWEKNKKIEIGLELGFIQDRFLLTSSWFQNRSSNMLINYNLPSQTGFTTILKNFPGLVQNRGWEFTLNAKVIKGKDFSWDITGNLTIQRNKLLAFPDLASSSYSGTYIIGQSLSNIQGYSYTGVDPQTGLFTYKDSDGDGTPDFGAPRGDVTPKYYGGISNIFRYRHFSLSLFGEFKKQLGYSALSSLYVSTTSPGFYGQLYPLLLENSWKQPGEVTDIQKLTQSTSSSAYKAASYFNSSSGKFTDASYFRLKTVSLSYVLPSEAIKKLHMDALQFYATAQNLLTITKYKNGAPETQSLRTLPPLKSYVFGVQLNF